ncbi:hypothetical protein POL68_21415 [Stigmatella sp. ncwal1]|uniref:Uncharacterized protein n=1 Tax=Stigmatella ashevillensis TaxID=2995309 RepID=A0ABT5DBJ9_9BACT|nr:hypothetical protein [Stigmatella ashevillena]MDC0711045.1 hypothetical protein [Stigmatella ashevillena]
MRQPLAYFLLLTLAAGEALGADYQNPQIRAISSPECVGVDAIRSQVQPILTDNHFYLNVRHMGDPGSAELAGEVANLVTWDAGQYTGFTPPFPYENWQRGYYNYGPPTGSNAFQAYCYNIGSMINTWGFPHTVPVTGGGPHSVYEVRYSNPVTPWRTASSELTLQANIKIPWVATWSGGIGQLSFIFYLRDTVSNKLFAYVMGVFDTRPFGDGNGTEAVSSDTFTPFVSVPFTSNLQYATVSPFSATMRNVYPWSTGDFFRIHVSASKLQAAINAVNANYPGTNLSSTPKPGCAFTACNYELLEAGVLHEVFVGTNASTNISMGVNIYGFAVYEFY